MVAVGHVAGLAGGGATAFRLTLPYGAVLGGFPHLPLRMVEAHVAGAAGARVLCLGPGEAVAGVAGIAGGRAVAMNFRPRDRADLMAGGAPLEPLGPADRDRLVVDHGHCLHGGPGQSMLPV